MTMMRSGTPIWMAARPMPSALVHAFDHVVDQLSRRRVDSFDGLRDRFEARSGAVRIGSNGHRRK